MEDFHRLALVNVAVENNNKLKASNIEFDLPQPSYTIDTLTYIQEKHPEHSFSIIMGEDNLRTLHKWKNYEQILTNYIIYVYPTPGYIHCTVISITYHSRLVVIHGMTCGKHTMHYPSRVWSLHMVGNHM